MNSVVVREAPGRGLGLFAARDICRGEVVTLYSGWLVTANKCSPTHTILTPAGLVDGYSGCRVQLRHPGIAFEDMGAFINSSFGVGLPNVLLDIHSVRCVSEFERATRSANKSTKWLFDVVAMCDIVAGEECLASYPWR